MKMLILWMVMVMVPADSALTNNEQRRDDVVSLPRLRFVL